MNSVTFARLNLITKELKKQSLSLVHSLFPQFEVIVDVFKHIFSNVESKYIPFYFTEFCVKVATIMDVIETLEFGRLRSRYLTVVHERFVSVDKKGGFIVTPRPCEKDLALTTCSHEGMTFLFKIHEVCIILAAKTNPLIYFFVFHRRNKIRMRILPYETFLQMI